MNNHSTRRMTCRSRMRLTPAVLLLLAAVACRAGEEPAAELIADTPYDTLTGWTSLTYSKQQFGRHLTTTLALSEPAAQSMSGNGMPLPANPPAPLTASRPALLEITALADDSTTELRIWFDAVTGAVLQRDRLRPGPEGSRKIYRFGRAGANRLRLAPASRDQAQAPADSWSLRRETSYAYDMERAGCETITVPALLLVLLPRLEAEARGVSRCVFASDALYRVWLEPQGSASIEVDYSLTVGAESQRVRGRHLLEKIALRIEPVSPDAEPADFELLELRGDIILYLDRASGLPVQITGSRSLLKEISIPLSAATLPR